MNSSSDLPNSWDCHTHVLDPSRFPYRSDRKYTPAAAPLSALIRNSTAQNIVIVQATPEDSEDGLLQHLSEAQQSHPNRTFRGTIVADTSPARDVRHFEPTRVQHLHSAGVRCIRLQGVYSAMGSSTATIETYLGAAAASYPIAQLGWSICMQLPLGVWAALHDFLLAGDEASGLARVAVIADHNGSARPEDLDSPAFQSFLDLLRSRPNMYVKIGALHRRAPRNFTAMEGIVRALVEAAPRGVLWGSDWPHVDTTKAALEEAPHIEGVSAPAELQAIRTWLSEEQFHAMMVENPARLFA